MTMSDTRYVIAPSYRQAMLFIRDMGWTLPADVIKLIMEPRHMMGLNLYGREVWWLDRLWPCRTHEDVANMEEMMFMARARGADIRRWYT